MEEMIDCEEFSIADYSSLRSSKKAIHQLDALLPKFKEIDVELKNLRSVLENGCIRWPSLKVLDL